MPREEPSASAFADQEHRHSHSTNCRRGFRLFPATSGDLTAARIFGDGSERLLHSRIDPIAEAEEWASLQQAVRGRAVVVGIGLGYAASALRRRHPEIGEYWLIEADAQLLRTAAGIASFARLPEEHCRVLSGWEERNLCARLRSGLGGDFSIHITPSAMAVEPCLYGAVVNDLRRRLHEIRLTEEGGDRETNTRARSVDLLIEEMRP